MSLQLDRYLTARADGLTVEQACELSGIGLGEAELHERDIERGEMELPQPSRARVHEADQHQGRTGMAENIAADALRLFIERIERLAEERKGIADDISDVFKEAKSQGFDTNAMKCVIKLRKMDKHTVEEAEALVGVYLEALGMTPIEHAIAMAA
jgi:uncharacterized protein (UPF0335 family)